MLACEKLSCFQKWNHEGPCEEWPKPKPKPKHSWAKMPNQARAGRARKSCSSCGESGHNRTTCPLLSEAR